MREHQRPQTLQIHQHLVSMVQHGQRDSRTHSEGEGEKDFEIDICNLDNVDPGKEAELVSLATRVASFLHLVDY